MRRALPWLAGLVCAFAASAGGVYESVPIDKDEWRLIEESKDLEGWFGAQSLLYEMEGHDPLVLGGSAVVLTLVALGAGFIPALRASRVDPMRALRYE